MNFWQTTKGHEFEQLAPVQIVGSEFRLPLEANAMYSLSTKGGQQRGGPLHPIPPSSEFPSAYSESFERTPVGNAARYLSDLNGAFEVARAPDGNGRCLAQVVKTLGIDWPLAQQPSPRTLGIRCRGEEIVASIGGKTIASVRDTTFRSGMAVLGTGWNTGYFDNLELHALNRK